MRFEHNFSRFKNIFIRLKNGRLMETKNKYSQSTLKMLVNVFLDIVKILTSYRFVTLQFN
jgi:hypothetical protein